MKDHNNAILQYLCECSAYFDIEKPISIKQISYALDIPVEDVYHSVFDLADEDVGGGIVKIVTKPPYSEDIESISEIMTCALTDRGKKELGFYRQFAIDRMKCMPKEDRNHIYEQYVGYGMNNSEILESIDALCNLPKFIAAMYLEENYISNKRQFIEKVSDLFVLLEWIKFDLDIRDSEINDEFLWKTFQLEQKMKQRKKKIEAENTNPTTK